MAPVDQAFNEWSLCYLVSIFRILMPLFPGTCLSQPRLSGDENAPISIKLTPLGSDLLGPYFGGLKHYSSQRAASSIAFRHFGYIMKILLPHPPSTSAQDVLYTFTYILSYILYVFYCSFSQSRVGRPLNERLLHRFL